MVYKITSEHTEVRKGERVELERRPLKTGALYLFQIGSVLILGRWFHGWIVQPSRWIDAGQAAVKVIGHVVRTLL